MPKVIAGMMALAALGVSLLVGVDPLNCVLRGAIAYVVGLFSANLWYAFIEPRTITWANEKSPQEATADEDLPKAA